MRRTRFPLYLAAAATTLFATAARADRMPMPPHTPAAYTQECSACHTAYPPGLLPAAGWKRIMGSLDKHFGTDASLDDKAAAELSRYLQSNAGTYKRATETPDARITSAAWFARKHREVAPETWRRRSVVGPFNCSACHGGAVQGDFSERNVRIPQ